MTQTPAAAPSTLPGNPPAQPGGNIDGLRAPGRKTVGKDHRFKVKKGIDLQGANIINALANPTRPDELASKDYVDRVAAGTAGAPGLTEAAGDVRYLQLSGGALTGSLEVLDAASPQEPVPLGQLQAYFYRFSDVGGLPSATNVPEGATAFIEDTAQLYYYQNGIWVGVSTSDNPQDSSIPATTGTPLAAGKTIGETVEIGTTTFQWNGFAWDRLTPIDFDVVRKNRADVSRLTAEEFVAPRANAVKPNNRGVNDLNMFWEPGAYKIQNAVNSPAGAGSLIVSGLGAGPGVGSNIAVEQIFFSWKEGTTPATIETGDVFVRSGFGQVWTPWERINEQWIIEQIESRNGFGKRFVGTYDAALLSLVAVPAGIPMPYAPGAAIPDPATVEDGDFLVVKVDSGGPVIDPNLPTNDDDGNPLELNKGDYLVNIRHVWHKIPGASGGALNLPIDAVDVTYDNSASGLASATVQAAINELALMPGAWKDILNNNAASGAGTVTNIVTAYNVEILEIDFKAIAATGSWTGKIVGSVDGTNFDYQIAWEFLQGATPPKMAFAPTIVGNKLTFDISTDIDSTKIVGKYMSI